MGNFKQRLINAEKEIGRSVVALNPSIKKQLSQDDTTLYFGIKDTNQFPHALLDKLLSIDDWQWLTIDKAASNGRAIDTDIHNPVTYRLMTGSTSGGPINIIKGITDFAIGTDGGGSVLAPAISCQLPAMIGAGIGMQLEKNKTSTDGINFVGSVGVIAKKMQQVVDVIEKLSERSFNIPQRERLTIAIPKKGTVISPDRVDMYEKVSHYLSMLDPNDYSIIEMDMQGMEYREKGIAVIQEAFQRLNVDLIVTCEGPIDVYGYGETMPSTFGTVGKEIFDQNGKYLVRVANMCQTTAITVPTECLATGLLIIANTGYANCMNAISLAKKLEEKIVLPHAWVQQMNMKKETDAGLSDYIKKNIRE
ncbi:MULTISPECIES: hypothetical protein [unclassified Virgibacillus]|uniref:hypothetical protein n=1 Tax=unclassified Virgibacillus TaxID=2620237 RepID=UPI0024DEA9F1|nr:hypothetical protein [Virgibacillus sp. LDC-1]